MVGEGQEGQGLGEGGARAEGEGAAGEARGGKATGEAALRSHLISLVHEGTSPPLLFPGSLEPVPEEVVRRLLPPELRKLHEDTLVRRLRIHIYIW